MEQKTKRMHLSEMEGPITAGRVVWVDLEEGGFVEDHYHRLVINAAYRLRRSGFGHFVYHTGWGCQTLWKDPNSTGSLTVSIDGQLD